MSTAREPGHLPLLVVFASSPLPPSCDVPQHSQHVPPAETSKIKEGKYFKITWNSSMKQFQTTESSLSLLKALSPCFLGGSYFGTWKPEMWLQVSLQIEKSPSICTVALPVSCAFNFCLISWRNIYVHSCKDMSWMPKAQFIPWTRYFENLLNRKLLLKALPVHVGWTGGWENVRKWEACCFRECCRHPSWTPTANQTAHAIASSYKAQHLP